MRDTSKLPTAGPVVLAIVAELVVVLSTFAGAAWIVSTWMPTP